MATNCYCNTFLFRGVTYTVHLVPSLLALALQHRYDDTCRSWTPTVQLRNFYYTMKVQELSLHLIVAHGIMNQYSRLKHLNSQSLKRLHESPRAIIASYRSIWYHELVLQAQTLEQPKPQEILLCHFSLLHSVFTLHLTGRSLDIYMPLKSIKDWSQSQTPLSHKKKCSGKPSQFLGLGCSV